MPSKAQCDGEMSSGQFFPSLGCAWAGLFGYDTGVAPPRYLGPNQTVDEVINQQMIDQQALNVSNVHSTWEDIVAGSISEVPEKISNLSNISWATVGLIGIGVVGLVVLMGDRGPRRYGR